MKPIVFLFMLSACSLQAQIKLQGSVTDSLGNKLANAGIHLTGLGSAKNTDALTDGAGLFSFSQLIPGDYTLTIEYTGYQPYQSRLHLVADSSIRLLLSLSNSALEAVTVTATKSTIKNNQEKLVYNISSSVTATGSDALTVVGKIPGVRVSGTEISLAGKGVLKVMVNNRLVQLAGLDLTRYLRSMSANQVSTIELIKNPSANFDAEGNAGLINITTKHNGQQGFSGNIQVSQKQWLHNPKGIFKKSNYWLTSASTNLQYNTDRWSAYGNLTVDQDYELLGFETEINYPKQRWLQNTAGYYSYQNYNAMAGFDYTVSPKTSVGFSYQGGKNIYGGYDDVNNPIYNNSGSLDSSLRTNATYYPVAVSHAVNLHSLVQFGAKGSKLLVNADYFKYYRTDISDFESTVFLPIGSGPSSPPVRYFDTNEQDINVYTIKADADIPTDFVNISFGAKLSYIDNYSNVFYYDKDPHNKLTYNTDLSNEFKYAENTQSLYGSISKDAGAWKYSAGLRAEYTRTEGYSLTLKQTNVNTYFRLFPSLSLSYQADSSSNFSMSVGRRINRPTFWNLNPYISFYTAYSYGKGNPFLQPEYSSNLELAHVYKNRLTSTAFLNITTNGFTNVIIPSADTNFVYTVPLNFITTRRIGITENASFHFFSWLDNNNQFTLYHTNANSALPYIQSVSGFGAYIASNNTIYLDKDKTFAAAVNFWYQFPEIDHIGRADAYYRFDVGLSALAFKKKLSLALNLNDAFRSSAVTTHTTVNGVPVRFSNFQLNRFIQLALSYRFGSRSNGEKRGTGNEEERGRIH